MTIPERSETEHPHLRRYHLGLRLITAYSGPRLTPGVRRLMRPTGVLPLPPYKARPFDESELDQLEPGLAEHVKRADMLQTTDIEEACRLAGLRLGWVHVGLGLPT